jgi:hypothetical protein
MKVLCEDDVVVFTDMIDAVSNVREIARCKPAVKGKFEKEDLPPVYNFSIYCALKMFKSADTLSKEACNNVWNDIARAHG